MKPSNQDPEQAAVPSANELGIDVETLWQAADKLRGSSLGFASRDKTGKKMTVGGRDRRAETLFIDATGLTV